MADLFNFYKTFFDTTRIFGGMPYRLTLGFDGQLEVEQVKKGWTYMLFVFNVCFYAFLSVKQLFLFACTVASPEAEEIKLFLQFVYIVGPITVLAMPINQIWYGEEISNLFTLLISGQRQIDQLTEQKPKKGKPWFRICRIQLKLFYWALFGSFAATFLFYSLFPRFPVYLYYLAPSEGEIWNSAIVSYVIGIPDIYAMPLAWIYLFSLDLTSGIISSQLNHYLNSCSNLTPASAIKVCNGMQILMGLMNNALAKGIIVHQALITTLMLLMLYGAINLKGSLFVSGFLLVNGGLVLARTLYLLYPLALLQSKSDQIIHDLKRNKELLQNKAKRMEIRSLRHFCVSSGNIYKIDFHCIYNYVDFLVSYVVVIITA